MYCKLKFSSYCYKNKMCLVNACIYYSMIDNITDDEQSE